MILIYQLSKNTYKSLKKYQLGVKKKDVSRFKLSAGKFKKRKKNRMKPIDSLKNIVTTVL